MKLHPYLAFDGRCEEAFNFYKERLGAEIIVMMRHAGTPMAEHVPAEWQTKILHGQIKIADQIVMGADSPPGRYEKPLGFSLTLVPTSAEEAERLYAELIEGGEVRMALQKTFWSARFGMLVDRFGIPWMINCDQQGAENA